MKLTRRLLLSLLLVLGLVRVVGYLVYAVASFSTPMETYFLEGKMVLLAFRVRSGLSLYPAWRDYPHVANFFGPAYFWIVGMVGRGVGAEIPGLFGIGRGLSFGAGLALSVVMGVITARRYGRAAGVTGAILSFGVAPMVGFSVMVRPDLVAEFLGVTGYFLAGSRVPWRRFLGMIVLVLATLTKQTALIYLGAAVLSWLIQGEFRRAIRLGLGGGGTLGRDRSGDHLAGRAELPLGFIGRVENRLEPVGIPANRGGGWW